MKNRIARNWEIDNCESLADLIVDSWDMDTLIQFAKDKVYDYLHNDRDTFYQEYDQYYEGADNVTLEDLDTSEYEFIQSEQEVDSILKMIGSDMGYRYLVVKRDKSGADLEEVWGGESAKMETIYDRIK